MLKLLASATETEQRSAAEIRRQWFIALAIGVAAFWLYTRHNDFPFYYHPDEPSKVTQIRGGTRNYNHPLLLLTTTDLVRAISGGTTDCQQIVEIGRICSAFFAALAAAVFSWLGFNRFGVTGGVVGGVAMLLQRRLYEHAHFMKEDAALLAGIALTFLAIDAFWRRPTAWRAVLLGAATGLAASGKYIGVLMVPFALAALLGRRKYSLGAVAFAPMFLAVIAAINYPAVLSLGAMAGGVSGEITRLNSRSGVEVGFSRVEWLRRLLDVSPFLLALFLYHLRHVFRNFRRITLPELLLTAFPFVLGLILSFSSKQSGRHMLPALMVVVFLAAIAAIRFARELHERQARFATPIISALIVAALTYDLVATSLMVRGFQRDHRRELVDWISAHVPRDATIGVEDRVGIPYDKPRRFCEIESPLPQAIRGSRFAADLGTIDELRAAGTTHVAITEAASDTFLDAETSAARRADPDFQRRRQFYQHLFAEGRLVWSRETGNVGVLNPALRLYEIAPPASARPQ